MLSCIHKFFHKCFHAFTNACFHFTGGDSQGEGAVGGVDWEAVRSVLIVLGSALASSLAYLPRTTAQLYNRFVIRKAEFELNLS